MSGLSRDAEYSGLEIIQKNKNIGVIAYLQFLFLLKRQWKRIMCEIVKCLAVNSARIAE